MDLEKVRQAAERVARSEGLEIADVEWKVGKQRFLRVYIDRLPEQAGASGSVNSNGTDGASSASSEGGDSETEQAPVSNPYPKITHRDCERVSQQLSVILDVEDLIPGPTGYVLEVSSPGMDRALKKLAEYERFRGRLAKIVTSELVDNAKFFEGRLAGVADGKVRVELQGKHARMVEIPLETIRKANLVVEF
ncbi:MAG: ribosome maturation factor RimP [Candidatus Acidiferrum sp.]